MSDDLAKQRARWRMSSGRGALVMMLAYAVCSVWSGPVSAITPAANGYRLSPWPAGVTSPDFQLVDGDGRPRTMADYRGHVAVVFFGFTHCPDVCPAELSKLAVVAKKLGHLRSRLRVLFVTLDPQRDVPSLLKSYVGAFDLDFVGLTGTPAAVDEAARSFFVRYARVNTGDDYVIDHTTGVFVLDGAGHLRLVGTGSTSIADLSHDIALLAQDTVASGETD